MPDSYTEVTSQSWFSRIQDSIKGIGIGLLLFIVAFPLLFWNEGRAVKRYNALNDGAGQVISVSSAKIDPANEGKLVHTHGNVKSTLPLSDTEFGVQATALQLSRHVEMFQWKESTSKTTEKKLGGGTETKTHYKYAKGWSGSVISSSNFKITEGHQNPTSMPYSSETWIAEDAKLGAYELSTSQVSSLGGFKTYQAKKLPAELVGKAKLSGGGFFIGANPSSPQIGDLKVTFKIAPAQDATFVAKQSGNNLTKHRVKDGSIHLVERGIVGVDEVFQKAEDGNAMMTWLLRLAGFVAMFVGLSMILKVLEVIADVIPMIGSLIGIGRSIVSFLVAAPLTFITIAIAWIFYRPLIGIALLVLAVGCFVGLKVLAPKGGSTAKMKTEAA